MNDLEKTHSSDNDNQCSAYRQNKKNINKKFTKILDLLKVEIAPYNIRSFAYDQDNISNIDIETKLQSSNVLLTLNNRISELEKDKDSNKSAISELQIGQKNIMNDMNSLKHSFEVAQSRTDSKLDLLLSNLGLLRNKMSEQASSNQQQSIQQSQYQQLQQTEQTSNDQPLQSSNQSLVQHQQIINQQSTVDTHSNSTDGTTNDAN